MNDRIEKTIAELEQLVEQYENNLNKVALMAAEMRTKDMLLLLRQFKNTAYSKNWQTRDLDIIALCVDQITALIKDVYKIDQHG